MPSNGSHHEAELDEIVELQDQKGWLFKPRGFDIVWGDDKRYWRLPAKGEDGPARLLEVMSFHLTASTKEHLIPGKMYDIRFRLTKSDNISGWERPPFVIAKIGKRGKYIWQKIELKDMEIGKQVVVPQERFLIEVPTTNHSDTKLYFGLSEMWCGDWKNGLLIHDAEVREI